MAASSSSLFLTSCSPKTLLLSKSLITPSTLNTLTSSSSSLSSKLTPPNSISFALYKRFEPLSSRFVRCVAVSEFGQDEDVEDRVEQDFSPDLKLFVGNLPFNVDSAELAGLFGDAGTVEMVEVIYDKMTGKSRGFGFVTMSSVEETQAAAQKFNGYELEGRPLRVNAGPPPPRDSAPRTGFNNSSNRVHVGNLSWKVDDSALRTLFSEVGNILDAKVIYDRDSGRSRGFGFVTYGSADEVNNAIESLDGVDLNGRNIRVTVAEARPRRF